MLYKACFEKASSFTYRMLVNHRPSQQSSKEVTSHGNEVLPQDTTHLIQRPGYQRGSPYQASAGNRTTRRPDHRKETQNAVVWSCLPFIRCGQNHLARHSERGRRQADRGRGRKTAPGNEQAWSSPSPRGQWKTGKKWRNLVVKSSVSSVVPQQPSQLRDRWWWWWWWWWNYSQKSVISPSV